MGPNPNPNPNPRGWSRRISGAASVHEWLYVLSPKSQETLVITSVTIPECGITMRHLSGCSRSRAQAVSNAFHKKTKVVKYSMDDDSTSSEFSMF